MKRTNVSTHTQSYLIKSDVVLFNNTECPIIQEFHGAFAVSEEAYFVHNRPETLCIIKEADDDMANQFKTRRE